MADLILVVFSVIFSAATWGFVRLCVRLWEERA